MAYTDTDMDGADINMKALLGQVWRRRYRIIVVTLILCALTYALLLFVPKTFESSASLLVEPRDNVFLRATNDTGSGGTGIADDVLMSSQVELIQSSQALLRVVRSENLAEIPEFNGSAPSLFDPLFALLGRTANQRNLEQKVLARLSKSVTVIRERNSRVVSILVRAEDPALAAQIANALAETHVNSRAELSLSDTLDATQWLENEISKLRIRVVDAESAIAAFRVENDLFAGANSTSLIDQQLSNIAVQITAAQERGNTARSRANLINGLLRSGQPVDGVADVQNSVVIQRLSEEKARLQGERALLLATLLSNHPNIQSITAQINEIDKQILVEGRRVADALEAEAQIEETLTASLQGDLARLKVSASSATISNVQLQELEREAKAHRDLLETYLARYRDASARTDTGAALPDVRVISVALPPLISTAPKSKLILIAVGIVSAALQVGAILFAELATSGSAARSGVFRKDHPTNENDEPDLLFVDGAGLETAAPDTEPSDIEDGDQQQEFLEDENQSIDEETSARIKTAVDATSSSRDSEAEEADGSELAELAQALIAGRETTVILAALDRHGDCNGIGERLLAQVMDKGMSVAVVDAGSGVISEVPGISDLSAGDVEFGEVVITSQDGDLAEVFWGTLPKIVPHSEKPGTLIEALSDICEIVVVFAERVGIASSLPVFSGTNATLILVAGKELEVGEAQAISRDAQALGFERSLVVVASQREVNVA